MNDQAPIVCLPTSEWCELRDERGKLYARLHLRSWRLEVRRNHETMVFDLRSFVERGQVTVPATTEIG